MSAWKTVALGDVADLQAGVGFPVDLQGRSTGDYPLAKVGDISRAGRAGKTTLDSADHYVDEDDLDRLRAKVIPAGSVLFAKIGEAIRNNHRVMSGCPMLIDNNAMAVIPRASIDSRYLYEFLRTIDMYALASATTVPALRKSELQKIRVPLPPLPEQQRIAEMLDRAEGLRAKRRAALAQLDSLTQSIFIDMFGDPVANPKKWTVKSLGEIAREPANNGIFRKNHEYDEDRETGVPVVWVAELFRGDSIDVSASRRLVPTKAEMSKFGLSYGDVLFCRSSLKLDGIAFNNVYLGEADGALFECHMIRIRPDMEVISPIYLNRLLRLPQLRAIAKSKSKTATMTTIDQTSLCSIPVLVPPLILQQTFAHRITAIETLKTTHHAALAALDALFANLQHRAFRGEL